MARLRKDGEIERLKKADEIYALTRRINDEREDVDAFYELAAHCEEVDVRIFDDGWEADKHYTYGAVLYYGYHVFNNGNGDYLTDIEDFDECIRILKGYLGEE